jgi:hypothetical protein
MMWSFVETEVVPGVELVGRGEGQCEDARLRFWRMA